MRNILFASAIVCVSLGVTGCGGDDSTTIAGDGGSDATAFDGSSPSDGSSGADSAANDAAGGNDGATADSGGGGDASSDAGNSDAGKSDAGDGGDAGFVVVNGCTAVSFADHTAAGDPRKILFPTNGAPAQYSIPCMKIKVGQTVDWNGGFSVHPLAPSGGDTPTPITAQSAGTDETATFPNAGVYGFHCTAHPNLMFGAIEVVP